MIDFIIQLYFGHYQKSIHLRGNLNDIKGILDSFLSSNLGFIEGIINSGSNKNAFGYLEIFCSKSDRIRNRELGNPYFILDYDVNNLGTPLINTISASTDVRELFRFPRNVLTS